MEDDIKLPEPPNMAWMLTFADLVSLLITFFVLLFSMKSVDTQRWDVLVGELSGIFAREERIIQTKPDETYSLEKVQVVEADPLSYIENLLQTRFRADPVLSQVKTRRDTKEDVLHITLPSYLLFDSGSAVLNKDGDAAIMQVADMIRHLDNRIDVAGHTDPTLVLSADFPSNWELGMLRSLAVVDLMVARGVPHPTALSYGSSRINEIPLDMGLLERNQQARRVEILIHGSE